MTSITLKQLRAFIAVAEQKRFRLAAEEIGLTQSAVSVLIKELEGHLGTSLFDRHTRLVGLTDAGRRFLPLVEDILGRVDNAVDLLDDLSNLRTGRVNVASAVVLAATYLPQKIRTFKERHPEIHVDIRDVHEARIKDLLLDRQVDIGIGSSRFMEGEINEKELFTDHLAVFCHIDHELARKREKVQWQDLANQEFVALNADNPLQKKIDQIFEERKIPIQKTYSVQFSTTLLALIEQGLGIGVLPDSSRGLTGNTNIAILPVSGHLEPRKVVVLTLRERSLSPAAAAFYAHLLS
ncbi:MAG: LysR family transcriptional regulator [Rhodobacteraceae bacterium]|nr:LysR family transcriptional regulator [Paracoccaceae bacterium]